ncbi:MULTISPECIES: hypothetical protein [unclassified Planococcus (in: firmicutes)]|uniref:hypothetical protein n=1 Tax=unclassified Planococcus (in: firmicutes) TaxID=2662419 RepID=UPI001F45E75A|nr:MULTISPECIES: hypothetical protein [unclassified Planococcus (in: firmicutes)]UJF27844.1 hypothetical protein L0M13_05380 [Planococcus sp. 107-1]GKW47743.1 hypothetical protein NCCP2050_34350 [Planococcus sp. NCCP-2050]
MAHSKWLKLGAAAFLSVGMLAACGDGDGDGDDDTIEVDDPVTGDEDPEGEGPQGEDQTDDDLEEDNQDGDEAE